MSENKKRLNPWIVTLILGVIAILFSFYALQSQSELTRVQEENQKLKDQAELCERTARQAQQKAADAEKMAMEEAMRANRAAEECRKSSKRK